MRTVAAAGVCALALLSVAAAQDVPPPEDEEVVVVTAQKREEAINSVPMSITALKGDTLLGRGVTRTADLAKVVPAFNYTESKAGTPIYTLRGVGFSDIALGGRPTVSVYQDQVPIPFTIETRGGNFDLERVEVLKGPQGTLFGQNATGGAINIIAAKPTDEFDAGLEVGYGNINATTLGGYLSGPLAPTLTARIAVRQEQSDGWQKSYTDGSDMGALNLTSGRLIFDWAPNEAVNVEFAVNGYLDRSESQAPQLFGILPSSPADAPKIPGLLTYPLAPRDNRAADWTPGDYSRDNSFVQANLRVDYDVSPAWRLVSLTSFSRYDQEQLQDIDGMTLASLQQVTYGTIDSFFQEARIEGNLNEHAYLVFGANYGHDETRETNYDDISESTQAYTFAALGLPLFNGFRLTNNQDIDTYALFANLDYQITNAVKLYGGVRYTKSINDFNGCTSDTGDGNTAFIFTQFQNFLRSLQGLPPHADIPPGGCVTADDFQIPELSVTRLDEDNISWRVGAEWQVAEKTLLYANASQGYKAGGFPTLGATSSRQYEPTLQESLIAYEVGLKSRVAAALQVNAAFFYYDYDDKQVLGIVADPAFGRLLKLVNIPTSRIEGAEIEANWSPVEGLHINASASYIDSKITRQFVAYNSNGVLQDFAGEPFPNTPKWQIVGDAGYEWSIAPGYGAFVGLSVNYQSETNTELGELPELRKKAYTLIDLRAGLEDPDDTWRLTAWVRNIGDVYYWSSAARDIDNYARFTGMPRTYGVTLTYSYN